MARLHLAAGSPQSSTRREPVIAKQEEKITHVPLSWLMQNRFGKGVSPLISPEDLACLKKSIREHGIQTPLIVWKNGPDLLIVAGLIRYQIARQLGLERVPVLIRQFDGVTEAKLFAMTDNLARRQLTTAQKVMLALEYQKLITVGQGRRTDLTPSSEMTDVDSHRIAAQWAGVSTGSMVNLRKVVESGDVALINDVVAGKLKITAALRHVKKCQHPVQTGLSRTTNDNTAPVYTCVEGDSSDLIASVSALYLRPGMVVADVTYGQGVFWEKLDLRQYQFMGTDLLTKKPAVDFRRLPYSNASIDVLVLDPPFQHNANVTLTGSGYQVRKFCRGLSHEQLIYLYAAGMQEAYRVLKSSGLLWVKCGDEVAAGRQRWSHIEIYTIGKKLDFQAQDLFILKRRSVAPPQTLPQQHARKNHSFLWVFQKTK